MASSPGPRRPSAGDLMDIGGFPRPRGFDDEPLDDPPQPMSHRGEVNSMSFDFDNDLARAQTPHADWRHRDPDTPQTHPVLTRTSTGMSSGVPSEPATPISPPRPSRGSTGNPPTRGSRVVDFAVEEENDEDFDIPEGVRGGQKGFDAGDGGGGVDGDGDHLPPGSGSWLRETWCPDVVSSIQRPLEVKVNKWPCVLLLFYTFAVVYYFIIRITRTLPRGGVTGYAWFVLFVEMLGTTSMFPYAILLTLSQLPRKGAVGLPTAAQVAAKKNVHEPVYYRFKVRVLIPCYKEGLEVISATVEGALKADLPAGTERVVYLCDDGNDPEKREYIAGLGDEAVYVTGRERKKGETNGKSSNLNNCLQNVIYSQYKNEDGVVEWQHVPWNEVMVVFDADMIAKKDFMVSILEVMTDPEIALCLTPQSFHNINPNTDLFNNTNLQFWEYWLPGAVSWGYIACTGTNFCIRMAPLAHAGFFPTYTITEDYALGMELKMLGYKGSYLLNYIAVGEAPEEVRNVMRQRSRWCKGHMQVFFDYHRCPLLNSRLPFAQRLWYTYGTWTYLITMITMPTFLLIPFFSLLFGINPIVLNKSFAVGGTIYFAATALIQNYARKLSHIKSLWFANLSNTVLWFTYTKAIMNVLLSALDLKGGVSFKATTKSVPAGGPKPSVGVIPALKNTMTRLTRQLSATGQALASAFSGPMRQGYVHTDDDPDRGSSSVPSSARAIRNYNHSGPLSGQPSSPLARVPLGSNGQELAVMRGPNSNLGSTGGGSGHEPINLTVIVNQPGPPASEANKLLGRGFGDTRPLKERAPWYKRLARVFSPQNVGDLGGVLDPLALVIMLLFCLTTIGIGIWRIVQIGPNRAGFISPYVTIPVLWAIVNMIPPYLFLHYCFTSGKSFKRGATYLQFLGTASMIVAIALLFASLPFFVDLKGGLRVSTDFIRSQAALAADTEDSAVLPAGAVVDMTGGMFVGGDPVKYVMPMASTISILAWGLMDFPKGFRKAGSTDKARESIKEGAQYLMNCFIEDETNPQFIVQVGDPAHYTTYGRLGFANRTWAPPLQDPEFAAKPRRTYMLNASTPGVDALGAAAAAIAAAAYIWRPLDAEFADAAVLKAQGIYGMAMLSKGVEKSYCDFIPCAVPVTYTETVLATVVPANASVETQCWIPDFSPEIRSCLPKRRASDCTAGLFKGAVFSIKERCCDYLRTAGVWDNQTTYQGACALDADQDTCYYPDKARRTCRNETLDPITGRGCSGVNLAIYGSATSCCASLQKDGVINQDAAGSGVCSPALTQCMVPDIGAGTCRTLSGSNCTAFGLLTSFDNLLACCNYIARAGSGSLDRSGACAVLSKASATAGGGKAATVTPQLSGRRLLASDATHVGSSSKWEEGGEEEGAAAPRWRVLLADEGQAAGEEGELEWHEVTADSLEELSERLQQGLEDASTEGPGRRLLEAPVFSPITRSNPSAQLQYVRVQVERTHDVSLFQSSSVLDDMAWAGTWLYLATDDTTYLGDATEYLEEHMDREVAFGLAGNASYYAFTWDNMAWGAATLLAKITDRAEFHEIARTFLRVWVQLESPGRPDELTDLLRVQSSDYRMGELEREASLMITRGNLTLLLPNTCVPERNHSANVTGGDVPGQMLTFGDPRGVQWETNCMDGIDNDCDGLIDLDDPDCPFLPVRTTFNQLHWTPDTPLPNTAGASFLALSYAETAANSETSPISDLQQRSLRCFALRQVAYILGENTVEERSYLAGFGKKAPSRIPHRISSCPSGAESEPTCDFRNGFFSGISNPHMEFVRGALVAGPDFNDTYQDDRWSKKNTINIDYNARLSGALAGMLSAGIDQDLCGQLRGAYQSIFQKEGGV